MKKPKLVGSIGCYTSCEARLGKKRFSFNGTTKDLVLQSVANGAYNGVIIMANFGGGLKEYKIVSAPHDNRANGFWADAVI